QRGRHLGSPQPGAVQLSPPGARAVEELTPAANPEGGSNLPRIPRKWRDDAIRVLYGMGYTVSGAQAWRLLKEWRAWRDDDVREFIADEFRTYLQRRGDFIAIRSKRHVPWAVKS